MGKPLSYILDTPELPDDADNPLRRVFGNEAAEADVARFAARFGCAVQDAYGSTEGGASVQRTPDTPRGALGRALPGTMVVDPDTGEECPRAVFDDEGRLLNAEEAIGEMVNPTGGAGFEGYWRNAEAEAARVRNGWYWTGDLAYRDEDDFFYFGGRDYDWLRVDGENFAAAPVEEVLQRHPDVVLASVYAVPDTVVGDQVMAALLLGEGREFDPEGFAGVPGRRGGHGDQMGAALRPDQRPAPGDRHHQGPQAGAAGRGLAVPGSGVVAPGEGRHRTGGCFPPTPMRWTRPSPTLSRTGAVSGRRRG